VGGVLKNSQRPPQSAIPLFCALIVNYNRADNFSNPSCRSQQIKLLWQAEAKMLRRNRVYVFPAVPSERVKLNQTSR
jgi:hypothetical protein